MNDNQENKQNENGKERESLSKRVAKFSAIIYLGLAITVVIVATVGIFSISYDYETSIPQISFPELSLNNDISIPQNTITPPENSELPVGNEQEGVDSELSEPDVEPRVMYYQPVEGNIIKKHSMDKLVFSET